MPTGGKRRGYNFSVSKFFNPIVVALRVVANDKSDKQLLFSGLFGTLIKCRRLTFSKQ